jgi:ribulose-phosphate 3-epimerase
MLDLKNLNKPYLLPSILSSNFWKLGEEVQAVTNAGISALHLDVMDGHFVPNLTIGPSIVSAIRKNSTLFLDTHLMLEYPLSYIEPFAKAGSNAISVHIESKDPLEEVLNRIHLQQCFAGLAVSPETPIEKTTPYLNQVDFFLVMSVSPGFGGQSFKPEILPKIRWLRQRTLVPIEVDGGIHLDNVAEVLEAGAQLIVAGHSVFKAPSLSERIQAFEKVFEKCLYA